MSTRQKRIVRLHHVGLLSWSEAKNLLLENGCKNRGDVEVLIGNETQYILAMVDAGLF